MIITKINQMNQNRCCSCGTSRNVTMWYLPRYYTLHDLHKSYVCEYCVVPLPFYEKEHKFETMFKIIGGKK